MLSVHPAPPPRQVSALRGPPGWLSAGSPPEAPLELFHLSFLSPTCPQRGFSTSVLVATRPDLLSKSHVFLWILFCVCVHCGVHREDALFKPRPHEGPCVVSDCMSSGARGASPQSRGSGRLSCPQGPSCPRCPRKARAQRTRDAGDGTPRTRPGPLSPKVARTNRLASGPLQADHWSGDRGPEGGALRPPVVGGPLMRTTKGNRAKPPTVHRSGKPPLGAGGPAPWAHPGLRRGSFGRKCSSVGTAAFKSKHIEAVSTHWGTLENSETPSEKIKLVCNPRRSGINPADASVQAVSSLDTHVADGLRPLPRSSGIADTQGPDTLGSHRHAAPRWALN